MKNRAMLAAAFWLSAATTNAAVQQREIEYESGNTVLKGLLAFDDSSSTRRPGVLVVHEWWGHDEHARSTARRLAAAGYVALALDMYGDGKQAHHPKEAAQLLTEVRSNLPLMRARFQAARELLQEQSVADASRIAAIGYCFGGSVVLEMARAGDPLRGVVSFHGALDTNEPAKPGSPMPEILVLTGGSDPLVPKSQVDAFDREMSAAGAQYRVVTYPSAQHSFTNPAATEYGRKFNLPEAYDEQADKASWQEMLSMLQRVMK